MMCTGDVWRRHDHQIAICTKGGSMAKREMPLDGFYVQSLITQGNHLSIRNDLSTFDNTGRDSSPNIKNLFRNEKGDLKTRIPIGRPQKDGAK